MRWAFRYVWGHADRRSLQRRCKHARYPAGRGATHRHLLLVQGSLQAVHRRGAHRMDNLKSTFREGEETTKETMRKADGDESIADKLGNAGDDIRKDLGDAGDNIRSGADDMGDDASRGTRTGDDVDDRLGNAGDDIRRN